MPASFSVYISGRVNPVSVEELSDAIEMKRREEKRRESVESFFGSGNERVDMS